MASSPRMCAWCQAGVRVKRADKSTHRQEPAGHTPQKDTGQPESTSPAGAEKTCDARRSEQCQRKRECQAARAEDGAERHQAPAQLGPADACLPARTSCGPPTRAAPPQRHGRRRMAAARPATAIQERQWALDAMLWRQLPHEPYPSAPPPCARVPSGQHAQLSAEPADGSQLAPPPPLAPPAARHRHPSHSTGLMRPPGGRVNSRFPRRSQPFLGAFSGTYPVVLECNTNYTSYY